MRIFLLLLATLLPARAEFIHPGLLHGEADLARMRAAVAKREGPIYEGFKVLVESPHSRSDYRLRGPFAEWGRGPSVRSGETESDAGAVYQNALRWAITGERAHAQKSIEILNAWTRTLKRISGKDAALAAGLQGFMFVNAAEILRHTDSGWSESDARKCERWLMEVWYPVIEKYAFFANANWDDAALRTKIAIAVYCNDRELFEETVRYAANGSGNGSITHTIVYPSGQCQETTRAQHYAQLGLGMLCSAAEVAWNQGVDLYGWEDNRILRGFEYTAKYGLGEEVPYQHYLDRTGKYGFGGRHKFYTTISTASRGSFWPIFERPLNHYLNRRGLPAPYMARVVAQKGPEAPHRDYVGLGTLTHRRPQVKASRATRVPGRPAGLVSRTTDAGIRLTWVRSVDPVSCTDAKGYTVKRATTPGGPYTEVVSGNREPRFEDKGVETETLYYYVVTAANEAGESGTSVELAAGAGLPSSWASADIGAVGVPGYTEYNGRAFSLEGEGRDIGGEADQFHFVYASMKGDGTITARIALAPSSTWTKPGVMIRERLEPDSRHASVLLLPSPWSGALVTRSSKGGESLTAGTTPLADPHVMYGNRLMRPYWVRLTRTGDKFTGFLSVNGRDWTELASATVPMGDTVYLGLPACSQLDNVTTTVTYDHVSIPGWRMPAVGDLEQPGR